MTNPFYTPTGAPTSASRGLSSPPRSEFALVGAGFDAVELAVNPTLATGTSTTSLLIGTGTKSFTMTAGRAFGAGQDVVIANTASPDNRMIGVLQSYNSTTGAAVVDVTSTGGSGTLAAWTISLNAASTADLVTYAAKTTGFTIADGNHDNWFDCTSGTFSITFSTGGMRVGFKCRIRNSGTGDITIPSSDSVTNWLMYANEERDFVWDGSVWRTTILRSFIKQYTASGTFIVPPGYGGTVDCVGVGGGAGGGSGSNRAANTATGGGGGGGPGAIKQRRIYGLTAGASIVVTIGAGGAGGVSVSGTSTSGNNGTAGGNTTFATYLTAYGGGAGGKGVTNGAGGGGGGGGGQAGIGGDASSGTPGTAGVPASAAAGFGGGAGSASNTAGLPAVLGAGGGGGGSDGTGSAGGAGANSLYSAGAGGGGGAQNAGGGVNAPGAGGATMNYATASGLGGAAGTAGGAGADGATGNAYTPGAGGGGGAALVTGATGAGGAGGAPGGGGGGGATALNAFATGAGGAGARGEIIVSGVIG